jgi:hypothetical protein
VRTRINRRALSRLPRRPAVFQPHSSMPSRPPLIKARLARLLGTLRSVPRIRFTRRAARYTAGYVSWAFLALPRVWGLVMTPDGVDELRASGSYNDVPGWLGPGAWLAYCVTTYTALARALYAVHAAWRLGVETPELPDGERPDVKDGADEVWDPDLTISALFTLLARVALLAKSRTGVDVDANLLILSAVGVAVVDGFCVGQLGSVLWLSVLWRVQRRLPADRLLAQDPQGRTALRRLAAYFMLALGSTSVLFVFNRRMGTRALPHTDSFGRDPFVLSIQSDF